jgi:hypothetical protein
MISVPLHIYTWLAFQKEYVASKNAISKVKLTPFRRIEPQKVVPVFSIYACNISLYPPSYATAF